jgi:hypothetical protein
VGGSVKTSERDLMIAVLAMVTNSNESAFEKLSDEELKKKYEERVENR